MLNHYNRLVLKLQVFFPKNKRNILKNFKKGGQGRALSLQSDIQQLFCGFVKNLLPLVVAEL